VPEAPCVAANVGSPAVAIGPGQQFHVGALARSAEESVRRILDDHAAPCPRQIDPSTHRGVLVKPCSSALRTSNIVPATCAPRPPRSRSRRCRHRPAGTKRIPSGVSQWTSMTFHPSNPSTCAMKFWSCPIVVSRRLATPRDDLRNAAESMGQLPVLRPGWIAGLTQASFSPPRAALAGKLSLPARNQAPRLSPKSGKKNGAVPQLPASHTISKGAAFAGG